MRRKSDFRYRWPLNGESPPLFPANRGQRSDLLEGRRQQEQTGRLQSAYFVNQYTLERMIGPDRTHPIATIPGALAIAVWGAYVGLAAFHSFDVPPWVLIAIAFGVLSCVALAVGYRHWRVAVLLASMIYLLLYAGRVIGLATSVTDVEKSSFFSALIFYYSTSWRATSWAFRNRGIFDGSVHAFLEYVMPVLIVVLIAVTLLSWARKRAMSSAG